MNRKEIITLAEKVGLLVKEEQFPYDMPSHQRLISRLEKFADEVITQDRLQAVVDASGDLE